PSEGSRASRPEPRGEGRGNPRPSPGQRRPRAEVPAGSRPRCVASRDPLQDEGPDAGRFVADGERTAEPVERAFTSRAVAEMGDAEGLAALHRIADLLREHEAHGGIDGILLPAPTGTEGHRRQADL